MDARLDTLLRRAAADTEVVGLAGGLPAAAQFPRAQLAMSFVRVMRQSGTPALQYGWAEGSNRLRDFIAGRLRLRGAHVSADDIIVTSGAQQAIAMALELCTVRGDTVAVDPETYPAALDLFRFRGVLAVPRLAGAACAYVMPVVSNPRGGALSADERRVLLQSNLSIVEDDAYADLRFSGPAPPPLLALAPDRVFHVGTLSKILCPGLRVGWLVVPRHLRQRALELKQGVDLQASSLSQSIVEDYLIGSASHPGIDLDARLSRLRRFYRRRALAMAKALRRHLPAWSFRFPEGGFALWVDTHAPIDEGVFLEAAIGAGVAFDPGSIFRPSGVTSSELSLRLCFSYAPLASFERGVRALAAAWAKMTGAPSRRVASGR